MPVSIEGKYTLVQSENFDEYMKVCGVGFVIRTLMRNATPTVDITRDGDYWVLTTVVSFKTIEHRFKIGEEYDADFPDGSGRKVKGMASLDGNILIQISKTKDGEVFLDSREFTEDEMIITLEHKGVKSRRIYRRQ